MTSKEERKGKKKKYENQKRGKNNFALVSKEEVTIYQDL